MFPPDCIWPQMPLHFHCSLVCQDRSRILTASLERWSFPKVASPDPDLQKDIQRWLLYSLEKHDDSSIHFLSFEGIVGMSSPGYMFVYPFNTILNISVGMGDFKDIEHQRNIFLHWKSPQGYPFEFFPVEILSFSMPNPPTCLAPFGEARECHRLVTQKFRGAGALVRQPTSVCLRPKDGMDLLLD